MKDFQDSKINKSKIIFTIILSIIILSLLGVGIFFLVKKGLENKKNSQVSYYLDIVDDKISRGNYEYAVETLDNISNLGEYKSVDYRVLKRAYILSSKLNNYEILLKFSKLAYDNFPKELEFRKLYIYSLLRTYNNSKAYKDLTPFIKGDDYSNLLTEAIIKNSDYEASKLYDENLTNIGKTVLSVAFGDNPRLFEDLFNYSGDYKLAINAILYYLKYGKIESAYNIFDAYISESLLSNINDEISRVNKNNSLYRIGAYLAYDMKKYEEALIYVQLVSIPEDSSLDRDWTLFVADINLKLENREKAKKLYTNFISRYPDFSYIPYFNLTFLVNDIDIALDFLNRGYEYFSSNTTIVLAISDYYLKLGDLDKAQKVLKEFLLVEPENIEATIQYNFLNSNVSPERYIGVLWNMYNLNKQDKNERIPVTLLWFLVGLNDTQEINRVLLTVEADYGYRSWISFYRGVLAIMQENFKDAYIYFRRCCDETVYKKIEKNRYYMSWQPFYNCALLSFYFNDYSQARIEIEELLLFLDDSNKEIYSKVKTLSGKIYLAQGDKAKALREFEIAKDSDSSNIEAVTYYNFSFGE